LAQLRIAVSVKRTTVGKMGMQQKWTIENKLEYHLYKNSQLNMGA
jgi:hypothetical protein